MTRQLLETIPIASLRASTRRMTSWRKSALAAGRIDDRDRVEYVWPIGRPVVEVWVERDHG